MVKHQGSYRLFCKKVDDKLGNLTDEFSLNKPLLIYPEQREQVLFHKNKL